MSEFFDILETRPPEQREAELFTLLSAQVAHAQESAPAVADMLAGVDATTLVRRSVLEKLPLLQKSELIERQKQTPIFGGLTALAPPELGQIFVSPGPIFEPGARRPDFWRFSRALYAAGLRSGETVQNCFSYHFTPAGMMFESGAHALGCAVVPAGVGQTDLQVQVMQHVRPQAYVGTPSFLKLIIDKADELGADISCLSKALVSGEYLPPSLREFFSVRGIAVLQCYATADLGLIAYESPAREGMIVDEGIILEIVRPGTALRILFMIKSSNAGSKNLGSQRDDLHKSLGAQFTRDRAEDARANGFQFVVEQYGRVAIKLDQGSVGATNALGCAYNHGAIDFALLDTTTRRGILDADLDDITNAGITAPGTTKHLDAHDRTCASVVGDIQQRLHLNHYFISNLIRD